VKRFAFCEKSELPSSNPDSARTLEQIGAVLIPETFPRLPVPFMGTAGVV
jgi:hypothetical protein